MGIFNGYMIMSDFDGTLTLDANTVSVENQNAIKHFQDEGGLFALSSGRDPEFLLTLRDFFVPNCYSAMLNGAMLCSPNADECIYETTMDPDFAFAFAQTVFKQCPTLKYVRCFGRENYIAMPTEQPFDRAYIPKPLYKLVFCTPVELSDDNYRTICRLCDETEYLKAARSWMSGIEVLIDGAGKGDAVAKLKSIYKERAKTVIAVGDFENDIDMLIAADIGYAVGNALPQVKAVADRITVHCRDNAIAKIIEELEAEIKQA